MCGAEVCRQCVVCQGLPTGCPECQRRQFSVDQEAGLANESRLFSHGVTVSVRRGKCHVKCTPSCTHGIIDIRQHRFLPMRVSREKRSAFLPWGVSALTWTLSSHLVQKKRVSSMALVAPSSQLRVQGTDYWRDDDIFRGNR